MAIETAITTGAGIVGSFDSIVPLKYATRPTIDPTERSMFRVSTTSVCPTATTATTATLVLMRVNVRADRNSGICGREERGHGDDDQDENQFAEALRPDVPQHGLHHGRPLVVGGRGCRLVHLRCVVLAHRGGQDALGGGSSRRRIAICRPSRMTRMRSLVARTSGRSELIRMMAMPSCGEVVDDAVHLGLRADIDAPCGLVEDEHPRMGLEPLAQHDLLLIATRQRRNRHANRRRTDAQPLSEGFRGTPSASRRTRRRRSRYRGRATATRRSRRSTSGRRAQRPSVLGRVGDP